MHRYRFVFHASRIIALLGSSRVANSLNNSNLPASGCYFLFMENTILQSRSVTLLWSCYIPVLICLKLELPFEIERGHFGMKLP
jgi:hypothetical protein